MRSIGIFNMKTESKLFNKRKAKKRERRRMNRRKKFLVSRINEKYFVSYLRCSHLHWAFHRDRKLNFHPKSCSKPSISNLYLKF